MGSRRLVPRVKLWFEWNGTYAFGYGIARILDLVEQHGSIRAAADHLGHSYRYVWGRIRKQETRLGYRLVESKIGGQGSRRSHLTPRARRLVTRFLKLRQQLADTVRKTVDAFPE